MSFKWEFLSNYVLFHILEKEKKKKAKPKKETNPKYIKSLPSWSYMEVQI